MKRHSYDQSGNIKCEIMGDIIPFKHRPINRCYYCGIILSSHQGVIHDTEEWLERPDQELVRP